MMLAAAVTTATPTAAPTVTPGISRTPNLPAVIPQGRPPVRVETFPRIPAKENELARVAQWLRRQWDRLAGSANVGTELKKALESVRRWLRRMMAAGFSGNVATRTVKTGKVGLAIAAITGLIGIINASGWTRSAADWVRDIFQYLTDAVASFGPQTQPQTQTQEGGPPPVTPPQTQTQTQEAPRPDTSTAPRTETQPRLEQNPPVPPVGNREPPPPPPPPPPTDGVAPAPAPAVPFVLPPEYRTDDNEGPVNPVEMSRIATGTRTGLTFKLNEIDPDPVHRDGVSTGSRRLGLGRENPIEGVIAPRLPAGNDSNIYPVPVEPVRIERSQAERVSTSPRAAPAATEAMRESTPETTAVATPPPAAPAPVREDERVAIVQAAAKEKEAPAPQTGNPPAKTTTRAQGLPPSAANKASDKNTSDSGDKKSGDVPDPSMADKTREYQLYFLSQYAVENTF